MDRNRTLSVALVACKIFNVILLLSVGIYVLIFFHWHVNSEFYEQVKIKDIAGKSSSGISMEEISFTFSDIVATDAKPDVENIFTLGNLQVFSFYLIFVQVVFSVMLILLIIREIQKVIQSVQEFNSFRISNADSFRKIGQYCFLFFVATGFLFAQTSEGQFIGLYFHFTPIAFMLAAFVLSEIFKEGNKLYEEQQYTI